MDCMSVLPLGCWFLNFEEEESTDTLFYGDKKNKKQKKRDVNSPVPVQPLLIVSIKEMWLISNGSDVRVHPESLQQRSGPPLLHPDDDGLGKFLLSIIRGAVHPEFAVRGAEFLVLPLQRGGVIRRRRFSRRRLSPNPLHCPLFGLGVRLLRGSRGRPLGFGEFCKSLGGGIKFLPQCHKSCLLCHQPPLIHIVLLQRELQRVVAAHQAIEQVGDREGEGEHE